MTTFTATPVPAFLERLGRVPDALFALGTGGALAAVAGANGGYFPTSWGWAMLVFAWAALLAFVVGRAQALALEGVVLAAAVLALTLWTFASTLWSWDVASSVLDGERTLVVLSAVVGLVLLTRSRGHLLLGSVLAAIAGICSYSLATRLFPTAVGRFDATAGYRLFTPLGYWNSLGVFAAIGSLLALGFVARGRTFPARAAAGASLVVLAPTIYFTFSRGSWLALGIALAFLLALDPRRLQTSLVLAVAAPAPAAAVLIASRLPALTTQGASEAAATHAGHRLAIAIAVLIPAAAALVVSYCALERMIRPSRAVRAIYATALCVAVVAVVAVAVVHWGSPQTIAQRTWHAFASPPRATGTDLNKRLFQFSSNGRLDLWHFALDQYHTSPAAGTGAGTFTLWWYERRPLAAQVLDAHSLYLQTLAELGLVGLALLVLALAAPLVGAWRTRRSPLVPFAAAAFVAFVVHAGVDWDWQITAVPLAAFACAAALVQGVGAPRVRLGTRGRLVGAGAAALVAAAALVVTVGNQAYASAGNELVAGNRAQAYADARRAARWMPWSGRPLILVGELQAARGNTAQGLRTLRTAVAREPRSYLAWYALAGAATGAEQRHAAAQVVRLNPKSDEAAEMRALLAHRP